jgi:steroid 5-alpha reductase family enzyme
MNPWHVLGGIYCLAVVAMSLGWLWQRQHQNAGIVDVIWTGGLASSAITMALLSDGGVVPRLFLAVLGGLWALRLALHLAHRVASEPEDGRYRQLRLRWNGHQGKFFLVFQFQALLIVLFSLPFIAAATNPVATVTPWMLLGLCIWVGSVVGESIADRQLARFRADPRNKNVTCRAGLWRYSRHPNYFFEWLHWFTYVALAVGGPLVWLSFSGPVVMYVFLRWISGIPFTEAQALRSRGDDYRRYQKETPMLFPWFAQKEQT